MSIKFISRELNFEPVQYPAPGEVVIMAHVCTPDEEHFDTLTMSYDEWRAILRCWEQHGAGTTA